MQFNIFVGKILYFSTLDPDRAFNFFKQHRRKNRNVRIEFVSRCVK